MRDIARTYGLRFVLFLVHYLGIALVVVNTFDFYGSEAIYLMEKGLLTMHGTPALLENLGVVYPPLPFLMTLPFAFLRVLVGPQIVNAVLLAGLSTALTTEIRKYSESRTVQFAFMCVLLFHPVYLYVIVLGKSIVLSVVLFSLYLWLALRFGFVGQLRDLILGGLVLGFMVLSSYESVFILLMMIPFIANVSGGLRYRSNWSVVAVIAMNVIPPVVAGIAWLYLNWVFTGNPWNFVESPYAYFRGIEAQLVYLGEVVSLRGDVIRSVLAVLARSALVFPFVFLLAWKIRNAQVLGMALSVPSALVIMLALGMSTFHIDFFIVLIPLSIILLAFVGLPEKRWVKVGWVLVLLASLPLGIVSLTISPHAEERAFGRLILGTPPAPTFVEERYLADSIAMVVPRDTRVLLDDTPGFGIVAFTRHPEWFVLPYQFSYRSACLSPTSRGLWYAVADPVFGGGAAQVVARMHPDVYHNGLAGSRERFRTSTWRIFETIRDMQTHENMDGQSAITPPEPVGEVP